MVYGSKMLKFELGDLCSEPLKEGNLIVMEVGSLENIKVPLMLLCMRRQVVDVAGNDGLS